MKVNNRWISRLVPGTQGMVSLKVNDAFPETLAVTAINAAGNTSAPATLLKR